jgi:transcriptional regulator with XRE-family HTH domain
MTSGELLREARHRHGLSQRRLARRAGASQAWISRLERNEVSPSIESLERLMLVMGETLKLGTEPLFGDDDDRQWRRAHRSRPMEERLERAFDAASFAADLHGAAGARR